jgi:hypothetical protein
MRVFVHSKRNATKNRALALDPMATTWPEFVRQLSDKFGFCVTEVCLDVDGQQVEIDDIGALHDGDWIVIDGISLDPLPAAASTAAVVTSNAANNAGNKKRSSRRAAAAAAAAAAATSSALDDASSSATTSADRADLSGVAPALLGLTNTLARLCHKLERYTDRLDEAQQRSVTQHEQLLKVLPTTRTSHHARPPRMSGATAPKKSVPPIDPSYERLRTIAMFEDHTAPVWCLTVSGTTLISGSEDATIRLWSLETMKAIGVLTGHDSTVHCLCTFSKRWLISGSDDKSVRVWDLNKLKCVNVAPDSHTQPIISIAVNSSSLFTGSLHEIQVFDMQGQAFRESGWKPVRTLTGHKGHWVHGLLLYQKFLISSSNNLIKVWNAESLEELRTCKTVQGGSIYALAVIEEDGKPVRLVTGTWESTIQIFDFPHARVHQDGAGAPGVGAQPCRQRPLPLLGLVRHLRQGVGRHHHVDAAPDRHALSPRRQGRGARRRRRLHLQRRHRLAHSRLGRAEEGRSLAAAVCAARWSGRRRTGCRADAGRRRTAGRRVQYGARHDTATTMIETHSQQWPLLFIFSSQIEASRHWKTLDNLVVIVVVIGIAHHRSH